MQLVFGHEGGYDNDPNDGGGETKYGISKKRYPDLDIKNLTRDQAVALYRRDFWDAFHCGELPWPLALVMFDCFVQFNPRNPIRWLQEALRVAADGVLGARTLAAARECTDPVAVALKVMIARSNYRATRPNYDYYGNGWRARDLAVMADAIRLWEGRHA